MPRKKTSRKVAPPGASAMLRELRRQILKGRLVPHSRLPAEGALCTRFGIGPYWVRTILRQLKREGLLNSRARSGVFVADPASAPAAGGSACAGFHVLDAHAPQRPRLTLVVSGWDRERRRVWQDICRGALQRDPGIAVAPEFPADEHEYRQALERCDLFTTTPHWLCEDGRTPDLALPLPPATAEGLPLQRAHLDAVVLDGALLGMPCVNTLVLGMINERLVGSDAAAGIRAAASWGEVFARLAEAARRVPGAVPLNLFPWRTMNLLHYRTFAAGGILDPASAALPVDRPAVREALEPVVAHRPLLSAEDPSAPFTELAPHYCAWIDYTYVYVREPPPEGFVPWRFPLGPGGAYAEAIGMCAVSRRTRHPDLCRRFLRFLVSDDVQRAMGAIPGEYPVSTRIPDPFASFPPGARAVLGEIRTRSRPFSPLGGGRYVGPGAGLRDLVRLFCRGGISIDEMLAGAADDRQDVPAARSAARKKEVHA